MKNILSLLAIIYVLKAIETQTYSSIKAENYPLISEAPEFSEMEISSSIKEFICIT